MRSRTPSKILSRVIQLALQNSPAHSHKRNLVHTSSSVLPIMSLNSSKDSKSAPAARIVDMAYRNCQTRIVDLRPLNLPMGSTTSDLAFRQLYNDYISANKSPDSKNHKHSRQLASAITSLTTGIAPPVAFPTETVYGLGADATNPSSISGIFAAKGRPSDNPLIVHVSSVEHLERCLGGTSDKSAIPDVYHDLIHEFWPGPLTILLPVPSDKIGVKFAPNVHPGQSTIGFRLPSSPYARFLIAVTDRPIAAPSANSSGKPSPTTAKHVLDDLDGKINFILDGGSCDVGVESTVVDGLGPIPLILRPGGLSKIELKRWGKQKGNVWANVENGWEVKKKESKRKRSDEPTGHLNGINGVQDEHHSHVNGTETSNRDQHGHKNENEDDSAAPRAPGMKYKHYAPNARMFLIESSTTSTVTPPSIQQHTANGEQSLTALHNLVIGVLKQNDFLPSMPSSAEKQNGDLAQHAISPSSTSIVISVLTSTSWPTFADLESCFPKWTVTPVPGHDAWSHIRLATPTTHIADKVARTIDVYSLDLGRESTTISNRLFAALRTCDDIRSDFILAEAPVKMSMDGRLGHAVDQVSVMEGNDEDEFETVLERMRKAASEIVQL